MYKNTWDSTIECILYFKIIDMENGETTLDDILKDVTNNIIHIGDKRMPHSIKLKDDDWV